MTKIIDPIDSAGMRGARREAIESHRSMLGCRRCGGWGYIRHMVPAACPTCDLCNGTGADPGQPPAGHQ